MSKHLPSNLKFLRHLSRILLILSLVTIPQLPAYALVVPTFGVQPDHGWVTGWDWPVSTTVNLTVDDDANAGNGTLYTDSKVAANDGSVTFNVEPTIDLVVGQYVTVDDGITTKTTQIQEVHFDSVDEAADTANGRGPANTPASVSIQTDIDQNNLGITIGSDGNWTADFSTIPFDIQNVVDANISVFDIDGDATIAHLPPPPTFIVQPVQGWVGGWNWPVGNTVNLTVDDDTNPGNGTIYTDSQVVAGDGSVWFPVEQDQPSVNLVPNQYITLEDGTTTKSTQIVEVYFDSVDEVADTASGRGPANATASVYVQTDVDQNNLDITIGSDGNWTADFNGILDVQNVVDANVNVPDADGDATMAHLPAYILHAVPSYPEVHGHDWLAGSTVTLTIYENANPGSNVLYTETKNADTDPTWCGYPCFDLAGVFNLQVGQYVEMTDGTTTKHLLVSPLTVTQIDTTNETVTGIANPNSIVSVDIHSQNGISRHVTAGGDGVWIADFSVIGDEPFEQNTANLGPGDNGRAIQFETTFTDDGTLEYWDIPLFDDVPIDHWAAPYINAIFNAGITGGCSITSFTYCLNDPVTRAQMAVFLEKGMQGSGFTPIDVAPTFTDTVGHWAEDWIEALKSDGITSGCGAGIYCPNASVTRAQMAVFLLKAMHGSGFTPSNTVPITFNDTSGHWAQYWIEQLAKEGITSGCGNGDYCPDSPVTRAQMAVFLTKAFGLTLP